MKKLIVLLSLLCTTSTFIPTFVHADDSGGIARPLSSGFVFPTVADSVTLNPAGLAGSDLGVYRGTYEQPQGATGQDYSASMAKATPNFGLGVSADAANNGGFRMGSGSLGAAVGAGVIRAGASATFSRLTLNGLSPSLAQWNVGAIIGRRDGIQFAAYATSVTDRANGNLAVGIGYSRIHKFQLELDAARPFAVTDSGSTPYTVTGSGVVYFGRFGLGAFAAEQTTATLSSPSGPTYGGSAEWTLLKGFVIDLRFSPGASGYWVAGVSVGL